MNIKLSCLSVAISVALVTSLNAEPLFITKGGGKPEQYWKAWQQAKNCDSDRAHERSPKEAHKNIKLPRKLPPDAGLSFKAGWRFPLECAVAPYAIIWDSVPLPQNAGVNGKYAGTSEVPADPITLYFSVSLARFFDSKLDQEKRGKVATKIVAKLVEAADAKALTKNNRARFGSKPFDYPTMNAVFAAAVAFIALERRMEPEQRAKVYAWLTPMIEASLNSKWGGVPDNKAIYRETLGALWGRFIDRPELVQRAAEAYRFHTRYMRPDGSFGRDASRGGTSVHYNTLTAEGMIFIAAMDAMDGGSLFDYSENGRDIHDPVSFMVDFAGDHALNAKYGRACEGSMGTIKEPSTYFLRLSSEGTAMTAMRVYAARYPDSELTKRMIARLPHLAMPLASGDTKFGALGCLLGSVP